MAYICRVLFVCLYKQPTIDDCTQRLTLCPHWTRPTDNVVSTDISSLRDAGSENSNCYRTMVHMRSDPKFVGMLSTNLNGWCPCSYGTRGFNTPRINILNWCTSGGFHICRCSHESWIVSGGVP